MKEIKEIVCENLVNFRKSRKWTQLELAEKVGYSDKAVSRWEHGEVVPDVETLARLAEIYEVDITAFFEENANPQTKKRLKLQMGNKITITLLSVVSVWFIVVFYYVYCQISSDRNPWQLFVLGVPISCVVAIVFNSIWGKRIYTFILASITLWSSITYFYLLMSDYNMWMIFILGAPLQIAIILCANLKGSGKRKEK